MSEQPVEQTVDRRRTTGASLSGTNLERAGDHNQRVTLQAIRVGGPITRAALAEITGLTAPAIANITKRLLDDGLVIEAGRRHGGRGQPAMRLAINPDGSFSIGVNIDRDHVTVLALDFAGQVRALSVQEADFPLPSEVLRFFRAESRKILKSLDVRQGRLLGVGVAIPDGFGRVNLSHRPEVYEAWNTVDVAALFGEVLPLPVFVENDAAAAAIGELQFGHGLRKPSFFYILISVGLGGGLVIEGNYFRGADGRSGEIGFLPVPDDGSGSARRLEDVVSLSALYALLQAEGFAVAHADDLAALPVDGQAVVDGWIERAADLLTGPVLSISCLVNPEAVYIGGRLPGPLVDRLAQALNRRLHEVDGVPAIAPVSRAALASDAPAMGAAILPFLDRLLPSRTALMKTAEG